MSTENKRKRKVIYYFLKIFEKPWLNLLSSPTFYFNKICNTFTWWFFYNKLGYNEWVFSVPVIRYKASALNFIQMIVLWTIVEASHAFFQEKQ